MRTLALVMAAISMACTVAAAQQRKPEPRVAIEVRLRNAADAQLLEVAVPDPASGRIARRPISDLMLRLSVNRGDLDAAMRLPNGQAINRDDGLMRVRLYVVSGGRLLKDGEARCDRWGEDTSICSLACDGGTFALRRNGLSLTLVVGKLPRGLDEAFRPGVRGGFSIAGCAGADDAELLLAPSGGRTTVELGFIE